MPGGYLAAGFAGTLAMNDFWNRIENTDRYTFQIRDEGAAGQLAHLYDFFTGLPFWQLEPVPATLGQALVTRVPGHCYVLYLPCGGEGWVALDGNKTVYQARWFDPRTGRYGDPWFLLGGQTHRFSAPDARDWVLRIHRVPP